MSRRLNLIRLVLWEKTLKVGLLIFRAVAEPRNSGKSAKSREIHKNTKNIAKFAVEILSNTCDVCTTYLKLISAIGAIYLP